MPLKPGEMSVENLLHVLAFCRGEYTAEALAAMDIALAAKGCRQRHVRSWREQFLLVRSADAICEKCGRELVLNEDELISGRFECPRCGHSQEVNYRELKPTAFPADLPACLAEATADGKPSDHSREMSNENLLKAFALERYRFIPGIKDHLKRLFVIRGYCRADIRAWREKNIPDQTAETTCMRCRARQTIPRNAIVDGEFTCPSCNRTQPVHYRWLEPFDAPSNQISRGEKTVSGDLPVPDMDSLSDAELLETLAMGGNDFSPHVRESIIRELVLRGHSREDIQVWREERPSGSVPPETSLAAFKPGGALAGWLTVLLGLLVGLDTLLIIRACKSPHVLELIEQPSSLNIIKTVGDDRAILIILSIIVFVGLVLSILFPLWLLRIYRNITPLTAKPTVIRLRSSLIELLTRIDNVILVNSMVKEVLLQCRPVESSDSFTESAATPALIKWQWYSVLAMGIALLLVGVIPDTWLVLIPYLIAAAIGSHAVVAVLTARLVYVIDHLQSAMYASKGGGSPA